jgi:uroporphyrinogen-III decarboxylase
MPHLSMAFIENNEKSIIKKRLKKMNLSEKKPRELYKERYERIMTTISIEEPDRVPIVPGVMFYPTEQYGMTKREAMYDLAKTAKAYSEVLTSLNIDALPPLLSIWPGELMDILGARVFKWPGAADENYRLEDHLPFQFVEGEYLKAEEYGELFEDPTGTILKKVIPRQFGALQGFSEFPEFSNLASGLGVMFSLPVFNAMPGTKRINDVLNAASEYFMKYISITNNYINSIKKLGFPLFNSGIALAPFDVISDLLRGMRGSMLDMYRHPEELKKLTNMFIEGQIKAGLQLAQMTPKVKVIFMPLHRGADGFMSNEQFEEFYWPGLTSVMEGLIKHNFIPGLFLEGGYNERLEYLADFAKNHKGKVLYWFDRTDLSKAKELFGDHACIKGNIPGSLLNAGTPQQVEDYVRESIEKCAEGGGYIIDGGVSGIPDEAKPENVKAMTDAVFKYGWYRK